MKIIKTLCKVLTIYIAGRCFRKLISNEEVDESVLIKVIRDLNIEILFTLLYSYGPHEKPHSRILFTRENREAELSTIVERLPYFRDNPERQIATFLLKKYSLNKDITMCVLEYTEKITHSNNPLICIKQFQWID